MYENSVLRNKEMQLIRVIVAANGLAAVIIPNPSDVSALRPGRHL